MKALVWLRSDLRIDDNPAFLNACEAYDEVSCIYIFSRKTWYKNNNSNVKEHFVLENLAKLKNELQQLNIDLCSFEVDTFDDSVELIKEYIAINAFKAIFWNNEFGYDENNRDQKLIAYLQKQDINFHQYHDQVIFSPGSLRTGQDKPFSVFTPFKKKWIENFSLDLFDFKKAPKKKNKFALVNPKDKKNISFNQTHQVNMEIWPAGEVEARKRLELFIEKSITLYSKNRNHPFLDATSRLSPYLALGILSPRRCIYEAIQKNNFELDAGNNGICKWVDEIVWREFYRNIMHNFPHVSKNKPFNLSTETIAWRNNQDEIDAWKNGKTGFPFIDAAMLQLTQEGWMHNRLRMVVAMFFTKNLLHDWRIGEAHFMNNLIDGDFSSNNGGWQWSASTGTDAAPYFRIFNPVTQSQNFDPDGEFIRKFIPSLNSVDNKNIHLPKSDLLNNIDYHNPIVDLKSSRIRAIDAFKSNRV